MVKQNSMEKVQGSILYLILYWFICVSILYVQLVCFYFRIMKRSFLNLMKNSLRVQMIIYLSKQAIKLYRLPLYQASDFVRCLFCTLC